MPSETNPACWKMSASSIASFKACPTRFRLAYREGLRPAQDTDALRTGSNWHSMHEVYAKVGKEAWEREDLNLGGEECAVLALDAVLAHLNEQYANVPTYKTPDEWALERQVLLTSFMAYQAYYANDPIEILASEVPFELPLNLPRTGLPLPKSEVLRVGKIDAVIRWQGAVCALERKSTSRSLDADSDYWQRWQKDSQVSMYALAFRDLVRVTATGVWTNGVLPPDFEKHLRGNVRFGNTLVDIWRKPTTKPATLTQKETAAFLDSMTYCGQKFEVERPMAPAGVAAYSVNGTPAEIEQGKKAIAIRETIEMYAARLMEDMMTRPEHYFQRREIARTDAELRAFERQLFAVYQSMKSCERNEAWIENESQCKATFHCAYIPICYGVGADRVCDGRTVPEKFKRIYVDLTVNGDTPDE